MSAEIIKKVWESGPENRSELLIMLALAYHADEAGECCPSVRELARKARMTTRGVQKLIRKLEAENWISIETGAAEHGFNAYTIHHERMVAPEDSSPARQFSLTSDAVCSREFVQ